MTSGVLSSTMVISMGGLCVMATCINPYGPRLLYMTAFFGEQPILQSVTEWQPLVPLLTFDSKALVVDTTAPTITSV